MRIARPCAVVQAPRSNTLLSLLAERKSSIAKQMVELQGYNADNKDTFTKEKAEAYKRLEKQKDECEKCEKAELKLQEAYDDSLEAHEHVENVDADVLAITTAKNAHVAALAAVEKAEKERDEYKTGGYLEAQKLAMSQVGALGCGDGSKIAQYDPLTTPDPISFDIKPILDKLNEAAEELRNKQKVVDLATAIADKKKAEYEAALKASTHCHPSYCTPDDITKAKTASGRKDAAVEVAKATKDAECAAIDVDKATPTAAPTALPVRKPEWVLGPPKSSCNTACNKIGLDCTANSEAKMYEAGISAATIRKSLGSAFGKLCPHGAWESTGDGAPMRYNGRQCEPGSKRSRNRCDRIPPARFPIQYICYCEQESAGTVTDMADESEDAAGDEEPAGPGADEP